ncbi:MAG TPA: PadR family transcriptional regulator [Candidatus Bathyarchaeia archaeon]|nr:PadR family transcriptional regulator [Candidatus Bathyarchaeia archaeon]
MTGLWTFASKDGKERGLLALFILHSLNQEPKSGYELLKEIGEKTEGIWVPSKGTLYPILKQLEEEDLIMVGETGKRSKTIFALTPTGEEALRTIKERKKESHEKLLQFKNLLIDIFGEEKIPMKGLLFEIRDVIDDVSRDKKPQAVRILEQCLADLKSLD